MTIIAAQHIMNTHEEHSRAPHDSAYEKGSAFTQGEYRPIGQAMVPIQDAGFIHADAAYDVVSASRGYIFRMNDHIKRFNASREKFLLKNPYSDEETGYRNLWGMSIDLNKCFGCNIQNAERPSLLFE